MVDWSIVVITLQSIGTVGASWLVATVLTRLITRGLKRAHAPPILARGVRDALTITWIAFAALGVLTLAGLVSVFSLLTISGIVGLAVSLALQNLLSNMIQSILIVSDGVLRLNDSVEFSGVKGHSDQNRVGQHG
ncbi:MAG TPA: hypothetical protein VE955_11375 [Candidatus Dormibacteraeota bacterium]|jgi:small conductance mechanosensitive channel|nr:hypothetical protein [Candidatus Dormibacteraeota bacterium]